MRDKSRRMSMQKFGRAGDWNVMFLDRCRPSRSGIGARGRLHGAWVLATMIAGLIGLEGAHAGEPHAVASDEIPAVSVRYVGTDAIYLDQGSRVGLTPGQHLEILRNGHVIGELEVLHVTDGRALTHLVSSTRKPKALDQVRILIKSQDNAGPAPTEGRPTEGHPTEGRPTEGRPSADHAHKEHRSELVPIADQQLATVWETALARDPRELVAYEKKGRAVQPFTSAVAELFLLSSSGTASLSATRFEQGVALWGKGTDLGLRGLDVRLRGDFDLRYDATTDRYLPGRRAYPLIREVAARYSAPGSDLTWSAGRFRPGTRFATLVDGVQGAWKGSSYDLVAFVGMKPRLTDLAPTGIQSNYGLAVKLRPQWEELRWNGEIAYGGDLAGLSMARQSFSLDNYLTWEKLTINQIATVDYLAPGGAYSGQTGLELAEAYGRVGYDLTKRLDLTMSARFYGRALLAIDAESLPEEWSAQLADRDITRVDGGLGITLSEERSLRPFVYTHRERRADGSSQEVLGGGVAYRRQHLKDGALALDVVADYGDGTQQQANLQVYLAGPILKDRLQLSGGLMTFWTFGHDTGLHTFQELLTARLTGQLRDRLEMYAALVSGLDVNLGTGPVLPTGSFFGELGVSYLW